MSTAIAGPARMARATAQAAPARRLDPTRLGDHLDRLYRAAYALTGNRQDAEDLVQETYVHLLARPRYLRSDDDIGYLLRALRNTFVNERRRARRAPAVHPLPEAEGVVADPRAPRPDRALEEREVFAAVAALPDDQREVLVAVDVAGLSYREAAHALGIKEGTLMSRLHRGRGRVARTLDG